MNSENSDNCHSEEEKEETSNTLLQWNKKERETSYFPENLHQNSIQQPNFQSRTEEESEIQQIQHGFERDSQEYGKFNSLLNQTNQIKQLENKVKDLQVILKNLEDQGILNEQTQFELKRQRIILEEKIQKVIKIRKQFEKEDEIARQERAKR